MSRSNAFDDELSQNVLKSLIDMGNNLNNISRKQNCLVSKEDNIADLNVMEYISHALSVQGDDIEFSNGENSECSDDALAYCNDLPSPEVPLKENSLDSHGEVYYDYENSENNEESDTESNNEGLMKIPSLSDVKNALLGAVSNAANTVFGASNLDSSSNSSADSEVEDKADNGKEFDDSDCDEGSKDDESVENEWVDDNDTGYDCILLSQDEFYALESEAAAVQAMEKQLLAEFSASKSKRNHIDIRNNQTAEYDESSNSDSGEVEGSVGQESLVTAEHEGYDNEISASDLQEQYGYSGTQTKVQLATTPPIATSDLGKYLDVANLAASLPDNVDTLPLPPPPADVDEESEAIDENISLNGHFGSILEKNDDENFPLYVPPVESVKKGKRLSVGERRRSEIIGQHRFKGVDNQYHCFFDLKVIFQPYHTGLEESREFLAEKGSIIAGRYAIEDTLGEAAFSSALRCADLEAEEGEDEWVCLKVIKNSKDFFDQSMDEIKLLQYINSRGDPDEHHVLRLIDFFYYREHLFIVSELLRDNLYEFGRAMLEAGNPSYYTIPRLKKIMREVMEALAYIHSLNLIHCDVKPENIVIRSFSRCEVKLIDFGSSCFTSDNLTNYIQSRSYRAPEVVLGCNYDQRIDIWSMGAVLAELHSGYVLFQNDSLATMLARIVGILGPLPSCLREGKEYHKFFTSSHISYEAVSSGDDETVTGYQLIYPKRTTLAHRLHLSPEQTDEGLRFTEQDSLFLDYVGQLLNLDYRARLTAAEALKHPWLDWLPGEEEQAYFKH